MNEGARLRVMEWVVREVLVHEPALRSWLRKVADPNDVEDIVQESYCRLSNLEDVSHIKNGRAYLFTTAKMIVLGNIRRSRIVKIQTVADIESYQVNCTAPSPEDVAVDRSHLGFVSEAIENLPERCRQVIKMRKIEGISQREVAQRLGVPEHTVENDVAKGLRLIQRAIAEGEEEAETSLESMIKHESRWLSTGNQR